MKRRTLLLFGPLLFFSAWAHPAEPVPPSQAIASAHPLATDAGFEILRAGGNAFDAAIAVAAALGVTDPAGSGLGGGGFFLLHRARDRRDVMVDGRERAPLAMGPDYYATRAPSASLDGVHAAGIPGTPAALAHLAKHYGRLPLARSLAPAVRLARDGVPISARYADWIALRRDALAASPAAAAVFLDGGRAPSAGFLLRQTDLAETLVQLGREGHAGFYSGPVAQRLVTGVRAAGGVWEERDLTLYRVVERTPVRTRYRGMVVVSAALPSSGGTMLAQMFSFLAARNAHSLPQAERTRAVVEAMHFAYRDRAHLLGDPDFVAVDVGRLTGDAYAAELAVAPLDLRPSAGSAGGENTTHLSVLDRDGNRVAATLSINTRFGSGFMPPGTGVLLNNEMDDFVTRPGSANVYGLTGKTANAVAPGKRPLSSMTPTFLETADRVVILGTPGGSRIVSMVLLAALEVERGTPLKEWIAQPRLHHQYRPPSIEYEAGALSDEERRLLAARGFPLRAHAGTWGDMQAIVWDRTAGRVDAASDPRGEGAARIEHAPTPAGTAAGDTPRSSRAAP